MSFVSWFLFAIFGGVGLAAIPMDCFYEFKNRPRKMDKAKLEDEKKNIKEETKSLMKLCDDASEIESEAKKKTFFNKTKRTYNNMVNKIKAATYILDRVYKH